MFDPFGDFENAGYLQNIEKEKSLAIIRLQEHAFFEANLETAMAYLQSFKGPLLYKHVLEVHRILFSEFYPWAGKDRHTLGVGRLVSKDTDIQFEVAELCQRAFQYGLDQGNNPVLMRSKPGMIMGTFAWAHPFLDGNGRSMLLVHMELCARAGFSIDWSKSAKGAYLQALKDEIKNPGQSKLDRYLEPFVLKQTGRQQLRRKIKAISGLDGSHNSIPNLVYRADDAEAIRRYEEFNRKRNKK